MVMNNDPTVAPRTPEEQAIIDAGVTIEKSADFFAPQIAGASLDPGMPVTDISVGDLLGQLIERGDNMAMMVLHERDPETGAVLNPSPAALVMAVHGEHAVREILEAVKIVAEKQEALRKKMEGNEAEELLKRMGMDEEEAKEFDDGFMDRSLVSPIDPNEAQGEE